MDDNLSDEDLKVCHESMLKEHIKNWQIALKAGEKVIAECERVANENKTVNLDFIEKYSLACHRCSVARERIKRLTAALGKVIT